MFSCLDLVLVGCFAFEIVRLATVDCHPTEISWTVRFPSI
jgi:hypothetical protein